MPFITPTVARELVTECSKKAAQECYSETSKLVTKQLRPIARDTGYIVGASAIVVALVYLVHILRQ